MALVNELLPDLKAQLSTLLQVYVPERFLSGDTTSKVFSSWERNWSQRPPAVVRLSGVQITSGFTVNYSSGQITFAVAPASTAVVTCEFYFSPYSDQELSSFLFRGVKELGSLLALRIDETTDLDTLYEVPVQDLAYLRVFEGLWGQVAGYHKWEIGGELVDKTAVAKAYSDIAVKKRDNIDKMIARLRINGLVSGQAATTAAI